MEIRDYLRMLRRGWPVIVLVTVLGIGAAGAYLALAPQRYEAKAVILVTTLSSSSSSSSDAEPTSPTDLEQGRQYAQSVAPTFADLITSSRILEPVAEELNPRRRVFDLQTLVTADSRESTALIDVTAAGETASEASDLANAVAREARDVVPSLAERPVRSTRSSVQLQIVQEALVPTDPVSPNPKRVLAIGFIVGAALGLALTIVQQALDTRLRTPDDVRATSSAPLLAVVPRVKRSQRQRVIVRDDPSNRAVEAYRVLRTNLVHLESTERTSLLVAGVGHRDDVLVPVNLAWSMAQTGRRVLLVDLDLRQSVVGDLLFLDKTGGMSEVLAGTGELRDLVQQTSQPGLDVLVAGTPQSSPSDLLSSQVVDRVLRQAEGLYDAVVLHAPPLAVYTDAAVLSRVVGSTLVTIPARRVRAADLDGALVALQNVRVDPLGLVLVGARAHGGDVGRLRGTGFRSRGVPAAVDWEHVADDGVRTDGARRSAPASPDGGER